VEGVAAEEEVEAEAVILRGSIREFQRILPVKFFFSEEDKNPEKGTDVQ
jgi:hypothetical protein